MTRPRLLLAALLGVWMFLCRGNLEEQWSVTAEARAKLGKLTWDERTAIEWPAGFRAAQEIARATPPGACVEVVAQTTPEKLAYYRARFPYYLYPRRVRWAIRQNAAMEWCEYTAIFRDEGASGPWEEAHLRDAAAQRKQVFAGERVEIYR